MSNDVSKIHPELPGKSAEPAPTLRIATEEAFTTPDLAESYRHLLAQNPSSLDSTLMRLLYVGGRSDSATRGTSAAGRIDRDAVARSLLPQLLDLGEHRLREMDACGIDVQVLSLASPGVQMFSSRLALDLARRVNDRLAEAVRSHPTRFAGLATVAPQEPREAAIELERAISQLGLCGLLINSHTNGVYLDDPTCWPLLETIQALNVPLYLHPRAPSDEMAAPFRDYRMEGAVWGFGVEAGTHAVRLMLSGTLDRFPKLRIILGHMGEALPFWLWRLDFMAAPGSRAGLRNELSPSEYFRRNFALTTSGVEDHDVLQLAIQKIGWENVLWAVDWPFQPNQPAVAFMDHAPLSASERQAIYSGNAERLFRLSVLRSGRGTAQKDGAKRAADDSPCSTSKKQ